MAGEKERFQLGFIQRLELRNVMLFLAFVFSVQRLWFSLLRLRTTSFYLKRRRSA